MSENQRWLARGFESADGIRRFNRARNAIEGLDEDGRRIGPGWSDPTVISLAHGEGVRRPHPSVVAAGVRALIDVDESSLDNYLYLSSFDALDEAIRRDFEAEGIPAEYARNVVVESGNSRLFMGFFNAVLEPGDVVLVPRTYYQAVNMWADLARVDLRVVATRAEDDFKLTPATLDEWLAANAEAAPRLKALIVFNPGYTGCLYDAADMAALAGWVAEHDVAVLEDSIFTQTEFVGERLVHLSSVPGMGDRVVTVDGGSKAYGLANIRIGWGCGGQAIIERMRHHVTATSICVPHLAKAMALAAIEGPTGYLRANIREATERLELVRGLLQEVNDEVETALGHRLATPFFSIAHEPRAGHSVMVTAAGLAGLRTLNGAVLRDSVDVTRYFLSEERVCFAPGLSNGFDDCTVRISFGCLGSEGTWLDHRPQEEWEVLRAVLGEFHPGLEPADLQRATSAVRREVAARSEDEPGTDLSTAGFAAGREQLRDALGGRVLRAAVRLAQENKETLRAAAGVDS